MNVFYRGKQGALHKIVANDTEDHVEAIKMVEDHLKETATVCTKPVLAVIEGGDKKNG